jgi:sporulation protein YlmC with PRC-barrel domain
MRINLTIWGLSLAALAAPVQAQNNPQVSPDQNNQVNQNALSPTQNAATHAATENQRQNGQTVWRDNTTMNRPPLGELERASKILGKDVKSTQNEKLGSVKELAIDLKNGRIAEVIIGTGGILGLDEKYRAVPPGALTCDKETKTLSLNIDAPRFNDSPSFKISDWDANAQQANVVEVYKYYGLTPYFGTADQGTLHAKPVELGNVERASKILGTTAHNMQNDRIGKVDDMLVDMRAGRIAEVVLASGGFLGMGDQYSAVPPQAFSFGAKPDELVLDTTKEALTSAPHYGANEWNTATTPEQVGTVYRSYHVDPYFNTAAVNENAAPDNTAQNVRDRNENSLTPLRQGTSQSDMEITRQIRKAIVAASNLSIDARNIKIITMNGHVTLRGPVKNIDEKRRIADLAASVTPAANIDNQLQVENGPTASVNP